MVNEFSLSKMEIHFDKGNLMIGVPQGVKRVLVGYYPPKEKYFLYLGFKSLEEAKKLYEYLLVKGFNKYNHDLDMGLNKPRKSEYFGDEFPWEIKWHRPPLDQVNKFINLDKKKQAAA